MRSRDRPGPRVSVRAGRPDDLPVLTDIEDDAARRFAEAGVPPHWWDGPTPPDRYVGNLGAGLLWIADCPDAGPIGFAACGLVDDALFIEEISVRRAYQERGVGTRLLDAVEAAAHGRHLTAVMLTTDRFLPWNGPYYARRGYDLLDRADHTPRLTAILDAEVAAGFDRDRRIVMTKPV